MKNVLVLTDFSKAADRALAQAEILGRSLGAEIHLFHKVSYPLPHPPAELLNQLDDTSKFDALLKEILEGPEREAKRELERRRASLVEAGVRAVSYLERSGEVFDRVAEAISNLSPDLVVMGTHGRSGLSKWLMGSVAERVLRHTRVDVLTLRQDSPLAGADGPLGEILVATDFSEHAGRALALARRLAQALEGTICLLHVIESRFVPRGDAGEQELIELNEELRQRSREALRAALGDVEGVVCLAEGNVAREIQRAAEDRGAALVAIGTRGRSGIGGPLIGSVAEKISRTCRLPVLAVR